MNAKIVLLVVGLLAGGLVGYVTRPEAAEIKIGPLSVEVQGDRPAGASGGELTVRVRPHAGQLGVSVVDNGSGITPEVLLHLFEPFYTTKPLGEGSGQGLDIARRIVQEHGGRLEATSQPGRTEFTAWLPIG